MGQAKRRTTKIRRKAVGGGIFGRFANFDKCRPEVAGDLISDVAVDWVVMDVRATFGESGLSIGLINYLTLCPAGPVLRITFPWYFIAFCSRPKVASDIVSATFVESVVPDNRVKS